MDQTNMYYNDQMDDYLYTKKSKYHTNRYYNTMYFTNRTIQDRYCCTPKLDSKVMY